MARHVVSMLRRGPAALRASDPVLEANAYAVASDLDLTIVLCDEGIELVVAAGVTLPGDLAGTELPASAGGQDLRGLVESGIDVRACVDDLTARGLTPDHLIPGVAPLEGDALDELLRTAEAVLVW